MIDIQQTAAPRTGSWRSPVVIGALGRFNHEKGFDILLQALHILSQAEPQLPWRLRLAGSGALDGKLRALARDLAIDRLVEFPGWISDKESFFSSIDIFVLPSRDESFGIVLLEAMKYSVPIVATRTTGPLEIIDDGVHGLLTDPDNPQALAMRLHELIGDPVLAAGMADRAFHRAREHFSRAVIGDRLDQILGGVVQVAAH
jgi:glycosyltransferase involved in cell wall biosynthesis